MARERLFYPPRTFPGVDHWQVQLLHVDGNWRTWTEHQTEHAAAARLARILERSPNETGIRIAHVAAPL